MNAKIERGTRVRLNWRGQVLQELRCVELFPDRAPMRVANAGDEGTVRCAPDRAGAFEVQFSLGRLVCDESMVTVLGPPEPPECVPDELKDVLRRYTGVEDDTEAGISCRELVKLCVRCYDRAAAKRYLTFDKWWETNAHMAALRHKAVITQSNLKDAVLTAWAAGLAEGVK